MRLEVIILPVLEVDRAKAFYELAGFHLDVDHHPNEAFRVVQLTPPGSACSITFGVGLGATAAGPIQGLHLVVTDVEAARAELVSRGVDVGEIFHFGPNGQAPGVDPEHHDYASYAPFSDPEGNGWLLQEVRGDHRS
jgi:hypothetical protein